MNYLNKKNICSLPIKYLVKRVESVLTRSDEEHDLDSYEIQLGDMTREISQRK